jgi:hypothetical protein
MLLKVFRLVGTLKPETPVKMGPAVEGPLSLCSFDANRTFGRKMHRRTVMHTIVIIALIINVTADGVSYVKATTGRPINMVRIIMSNAFNKYLLSENSVLKCRAA